MSSLPSCQSCKLMYSPMSEIATVDHIEGIVGILSDPSRVCAINLQPALLGLNSARVRILESVSVNH